MKYLVKYWVLNNLAFIYFLFAEWLEELITLQKKLYGFI